MVRPTENQTTHPRAVPSVLVGVFSVVVGLASVATIGFLNASSFFFLGILFLILGALAGPYAISLSRQAVKGIDSSNGVYGGRSTAQKGRILGIIGVVLWIALIIIGIIRLARGDV
jgi:hypothetical protein